MKEIAKVEQEIGGDGGKAVAAIGLEGPFLKAEISVSYPVMKLVEPATLAIDNALAVLEKNIPGEWDKPFIEQFKVQYKAELQKLLSA